VFCKIIFLQQSPPKPISHKKLILIFFIKMKNDKNQYLIYNKLKIRLIINKN